MTSKKILVCDDDPAMLTIVSHILVRKGFAVLTASDGEKGLASIEANSPSLLILDMEMPRKNGIQVLEELRARGTPVPYIIVLSAHEGREKHELAMKLGASEIMVKPFNAADLLKKIERLAAQGRV